MRVPSTYLGVFVPATWSVPENPITGGMGDLADFVGARFTVPEVPVITDGGLGDLTPNSSLWPIHLNTVLANARSEGMAGLAGDDCGCGCGGGGGCGGGLAGLGDFTGWLGQQMSLIESGDVATIALWGTGALALIYILFGFRGTGYKSARTEARAKYRAEVARLRAQYPTAYGRGRRAAEAF